jgi:hypothetical protein
MTKSARYKLLGAVLVATVAAAVFAPAPEEETALSAPVAGRQRASKESSSARQPAAARRERGQLSARNYRTDVPPIFPAAPRAARVEWRRTQPAVSAEVAPEAPPVPFRVFGRFVENGVPGMFVQLNERTLVARDGDVINELYKVESISDQTMTVLYLPLNVTQTISTAGAQ